MKHLKKYFPVRRGILRRVVDQIKAVDDLSFSIEKKEIVGLVGESGSGKSTAARSIIRLIEPTSGEIHFMGEELCSLSRKRMRQLRPHIQMVFQDPLASLNPRKTVLENIGEALLYHKRVVTQEEQVAVVESILTKVSLPKSALTQYPHQFSGGQQQRISIGRALALSPKLIICDEAVSALDLSVQAQILNLLDNLRKSDDLSYLFISHDLSVVRHICDRILVMYRGKVVESGPTKAIFGDPKHPYTKMLLSSAPKRHPRANRTETLPIFERATNFTDGCPFFSRCSVALPTCESSAPPCKTEGAHSYSCVH